MQILYGSFPYAKKYKYLEHFVSLHVSYAGKEYGNLSYSIMKNKAYTFKYIKLLNEKNKKENVSAFEMRFILKNSVNNEASYKNFFGSLNNKNPDAFIEKIINYVGFF